MTSCYEEQIAFTARHNSIRDELARANTQIALANTQIDLMTKSISTEKNRADFEAGEHAEQRARADAAEALLKEFGH